MFTCSADSDRYLAEEYRCTDETMAHPIAVNANGKTQFAQFRHTECDGSGAGSSDTPVFMSTKKDCRPERTVPCVHMMNAVCSSGRCALKGINDFVGCKDLCAGDGGGVVPFDGGGVDAG